MIAAFGVSLTLTWHSTALDITSFIAYTEHMAKNIQYLGHVKLPYKEILSLIHLKSTKVNTTYDTEDDCHFIDRSKKEMEYSKKIHALYHPNKKIGLFYRYSNKKLFGLMPKNFWKKFKMHKDTCRITIMRHPPGTVSIPHIDVYHNAVKELGKKGLDTNRIRRIWIPLTEPKLGHALFVGNEVAYNVKKGTVLTFNKNIPHSGCNVGDEDRFVLTLTGYYG